MEYRQVAVYLGKKYIGRFDNKERMNTVISNILHENWENGDGKLEPWDFSMQERIGKVFDYER